ncbi:RecA [Bacillus phage Janet]|nr:RecA [Bacillus phage Janet]
MVKAVKTNDVDFDLSVLTDIDSGLVLLQDSDYAEIKDRLPMFIPRLDRILGGGLPFGRMIEVAGVPSGGKSTLSHHIMRVATHLGCICVLIDVEGTSDKYRLAQLGIDTRKVIVKQPDITKGTALTVEEVGETIEKTLELFKAKFPDKPVVYVWDSVGQTPSMVELAKDFGEQNVGARAKAITQFVTKVAPLISQTKSLFVGINQVRDDIGGNPMFAQVKVPGGKAWEHAASIRLLIKKSSAITKTIKGQKEHLGHHMKVKTNKNKTCRPMQEVTTYLLADTGVDYEYNLINMAIDEKIASKSGQSYVYKDLAGIEHKKVEQNFLDWMRDDEEGNRVRQELLNRLIEIEYEGAIYPALRNETLPLDGWLDQVFDPADTAVDDTAIVNIQKAESLDDLLD